MTLAFSMLDNIFPLHNKLQNFHLKYPNVVCYTKWRIVNKYSLQFILKVMNTIILAIWDLYASSVGTLQIVYVTPNNIYDVVVSLASSFPKLPIVHVESE